MATTASPEHGKEHGNHHGGLHGNHHGHHGDHGKGGNVPGNHLEGHHGNHPHSAPPGNHFGNHGNHHGEHGKGGRLHGNQPEHPWARGRRHGDRQEEEEDHDDPEERGDPGDKHRGFRVAFPLRTNYQWARFRGSLGGGVRAITACLWLRPGGGPAAAAPPHVLGTPFSYAAPGQPNELVLLAWGGRPMELLVDDQAVPLSVSPQPGRWQHVCVSVCLCVRVSVCLCVRVSVCPCVSMVCPSVCPQAVPLSVSPQPGRWQHLCVSWAAAGGAWRSFQDGAPRGGGGGLASGHPLRANGVLVLGQEQDALGGRFDATQAFVGDIAEFHLWGRVLDAAEVAAVASCDTRPAGDLLAWAPGALELHGGATALPFDPCP
ncbi:neuronal pentraxin-1-like [Patagioenas fasciata]|uniref:neuronal pentraxin-1-like n=1 Tax=Patagioenas fasciata TaxID=372321 RepID=UPI003A9A3E22